MNEADLELAALDWLESLGYELRHGPEIGPDQPCAEQANEGPVVLEGRLRQARQRLNPEMLPSAVEKAFRMSTSGPTDRWGRPAACAGSRRAGKQRFPCGQPVHAQPT